MVSALNSYLWRPCPHFQVVCNGKLQVTLSAVAIEAFDVLKAPINLSAPQKLQASVKMRVTSPTIGIPCARPWVRSAHLYVLFKARATPLQGILLCELLGL